MSWSSLYLLYSPVLWSGCGETSPPSLLSQSHQVSIQFVSDRQNNNADFNITALEHWDCELPQGGGNNIWLWILVWKWKHRSHCRTVSMKSLMSSWSLVVLADNGRIGEEPEEYLHSRKCAVQVGLGLCSACPICSSLPSQPGQSDRSTCLISLSTHLISSNLVIHIYYNYMDWIFQLSSLSSW